MYKYIMQLLPNHVYRFSDIFLNGHVSLIYHSASEQRMELYAELLSVIS